MELNEFAKSRKQKISSKNKFRNKIIIYDGAKPYTK